MELWGVARGAGWSSGGSRDSRMKGRWSLNAAQARHLNVGEHVNMDTASSPVEGTTDSDHSPVLVQTVYKEQL